MILEKLTEEECYLLALLTDESGIDHAEFAMIDDTAMEPVLDEAGNPVLDEEGNVMIQRSDGCFRAFPFQYPWWRTKRKKQIDAAGRSVGKSLSIKLRAFAFPFLHQGEEMVITAPGDNHLQLVTDNIDALYRGCRLAREMLVNAGIGNGAVTHKPFMANFANGGRIVGRIPHLDGKNIKGCFSAGTLVFTRRGNIPVEDVVVGDEVFTHNHRWKKVTHTWVFDEPSPVHIKATRLSEGITCSTEQKFWIRSGNPLNMKRNQPEWKLGLELEDRASRRNRCHLMSPARFTDEDQPVFPFDHSGDLEALYWVFGLYQAEGSSSVKSGQMVFSVHEKEVGHVQDMIDRIGFKSYAYRKKGKGMDVCFSSGPFINFVRDHFGRTKSKRIPVWMFGAPEHLKGSFFDGAMYGDGYRKNAVSSEYVTVLRSLAYDMKLLGQSLGYTCSVHRNDTRTNFSSNGWYRVLVSDIPDTSNFVGDDVLAGVQEVTVSSEPIKVYDLTVEDDHSFVANSVFVSNTHPLWLEMDEASDYPPAGWAEIVETVKIQNPDARWRAHGVTRGVGDDFDKKIKGEDKTWFIHRLPAMYRPNWTDKERHDKIEEYGGSVDSVDYRRNVLGLPGDESSPMFVMHRITQNIDEDENSNYNANEYYNVYIDDAQLREVDSPLDILDFPIIHTEYENFWIGMDVGWTQSPSVIVVYAEVKTAKRGKKKDDNTSLKLLTKISLKRVSPEDQVTVMLEVIDFYRPQAFAMDATGSGFPLYGWIQKEVRQRSDLKYLLGRIKNYDFGSKIIVGFDDAVEVNSSKRDAWEEAAVKRPFIEASTDAMRVLIDAGRMPMPLDYELIGELQAIPKNISKIKVDEYGRQGRKTGMHILDAMRLACLAYQQKLVDKMIADHQKVWRPPKMITIG